MGILLTGGLGYIGSHVCVRLLSQGHQVIIVDNLANAHLAVLDGIKKIVPAELARLTFIQLDMLNQQGLAEVFKTHAIDTVIHLAGLKAVAESVADPLGYYHNNLVSTLHLLAAMKQADCKRLLFSSSATVYGSHPSPLCEDSPTGSGIGSPYGKSKFFIEEMLKDFAIAHNSFSITLLRYFNPVGAHASGLIGENPVGTPNNLLPVITKVACRQIPELAIFGNDYPTPDGTCIRDYVHVEDLAEAHACALTLPPGLHSYNVGTGNGVTVLEMVEAFQTFNDIAVPYRMAPRRPGDSGITYCRADKISRDLGWQPTKQLKDMVIDSWRWTNHIR